MMKNYDESVEIKQSKLHSFSYWPKRILIIRSGSGKTNRVSNLINEWPDIDKTYLYVKDPFESKYQLLINGREKVGIKKFKNSKAFIDYSQAIDMFMKIWKTIVGRRKGKC